MTLKVGDKAPEFSLPSTIGKDISLKDYKGSKVVLYFYPKDDTPGCTKESCGFRDTIDQFKEVGAVVFGVSGDNLDSHEKFLVKFGLNFPLLSDEHKLVCKAYGVWGQKESFGKKIVGIRRQTFLIDENGDLQKIWREINPENHSEEVLDIIKG